MIDSPLISVYVITYNHKNFIKQCLDSILMQKTNFAFEIVIGEDCSTDGTREIVFDYAKQYPDIIKVITSDNNVGANANCIRTFKACKGKYVATVEGDDYWTDPLKLQKQVDFLESNPKYMVTYHNAIIVNEKNEKISNSLLHGWWEELNYSKLHLKLGGWLPTLTRCYRNLIYEYPDEAFKIFSFDTLMICIYGEYGKAKYMKDIKPAAYRIHSGGISSGLSIYKATKNAGESFILISNYFKKKKQYCISFFWKKRAAYFLTDWEKYDNSKGIFQKLITLLTFAISNPIIVLNLLFWGKLVISFSPKLLDVLYKKKK